MWYRVAPLLITVGVFILDRITKLLIQNSRFLEFNVIQVIPGCLNIVHNENPGVAFGLFADSSGPLRTFVLIGLSAAVLVLIATVLIRGPKSGTPHNWFLRIGLALVLGGAVGNLFDRIVHGTVTDFVQVYAGQHYFPDFNVADSCITVGAALLIIDMWRGRAKHATVVNAPHS